MSHFYNDYPIISVKLTFSSISSALLAWFVNQPSTKGNSVLTVFIIVKDYGEITAEIFCSEQNYIKLLMCADDHF